MSTSAFNLNIWKSNCKIIIGYYIRYVLCALIIIIMNHNTSTSRMNYIKYIIWTQTI